MSSFLLLSCLEIVSIMFVIKRWNRQRTFMFWYWTILTVLIGISLVFRILLWPSGAQAQSSQSGVINCETIQGDMVCGSEEEIQKYAREKDMHNATTGMGGSVISLGTTVIGTGHPSYCKPGWTLVYVGSASFPISNPVKCAAVGDLRDPE